MTQPGQTENKEKKIGEILVEQKKVKSREVVTALREHLESVGVEFRFGARVVDLELNDRGLMGEGCIDVPQIRGWVEEAGFDGFVEVEIFSNRYWAMDQNEFLDLIKDAYLKHT